MLAVKMALVSVCGDLMLHRYAKTGDGPLLMMGYGAYGISLYHLVELYKKGNGMGWTNNMWNAITGITEMAISRFIGEKATERMWVGAALVGSGLLALGDY